MDGGLVAPDAVWPDARKLSFKDTNLSKLYFKGPVLFWKYSYLHSSSIYPCLSL